MSWKIDPSKVPYKVLRDGDKIPAIGLGTFGSDKYGPEAVSAAVRTALEMGYRLLDCAAVYGNEAQIGAVLKKAFQDGVVCREELHITSKVWNDHHQPGDLFVSLATTLRDLGLDYVDTYFVHWPFRNAHEPGCSGDVRSPNARPFSVDQFLETWRQMERVKEMGLVRHLGMSNMTIPKLEAVLPHCKILPDLLEMELHPTFQQRELFDYAVSHGIQPVGFCPLGSPSRPARDVAEGDLSDMQQPEVVEIAAAHGVHPAVICLKWAAQNGQIPIPFAVKPEQIASNLQAVCEDPLTEEEMNRLRGADHNCRLVKGQVFLWPGAKDWRALWDEDGKITQ